MTRPLTQTLLLAVVAVAFLVWATAATPNVDATTAEGALNTTTSELKSLWRSWYGTATHLLDAVHTAPTTPSASPTAKAVDSAKVVDEIKTLAHALHREEEKLVALLDNRAALKRQSWTWFLDQTIRNQVDSATLAVNNQRRKVESLFDDISVHWRQLKPLHGVRSRMFLSEFAVFLLTPILSVLDFFASAFSFGLLFFFLLLGPVALFFGMFFFSLGMAMLPMLGAGLIVLYTLEFPWFVIQYAPSPLEFVVSYTPFLLATYWLATKVAHTLRPVREYRYAMVRGQAPRPAAPATADRRTSSPATTPNSRRPGSVKVD